MFLQCLKGRPQDTACSAISTRPVLTVSEAGGGGVHSTLSGVMIDDQTQMITPTIASSVNRTPIPSLTNGNGGDLN